ncbi:MAG: autotransporter domain-containing protein, partial [Candidatus Competibacteraceae bacterium]|nr:autotransporter domain-containing protein [Candidatus Competibacteraceae bacterium]
EPEPPPLPTSGVADSGWRGGAGNWQGGPWEIPLGSPPSFPDNTQDTFFNVAIDTEAGQSARVTLNVSPTVDSLRVGEGNTLILPQGGELTVVEAPGRSGSGSATIQGTLLLEGGSLMAPRLDNPAQGRIEGNGSLSAFIDNAGTMVAQDGTLSLSGGGSYQGLLQAAQGAVLEFAGGSHQLDEASVSGQGTVRISAGEVVLNGGGYSLEGTTWVSGGQLAIRQDARSGQLRQSGGRLNLNATLNVEGQVQLEGGTLLIDNSGVLIAQQVVVEPGATLGGRGRVQGDLALQGGTLAPGSSPGTLTIEGDLDMESGVLAIELAGSQEGQYDRLAVTGSATISGGILDFTLIEDFTPAIGDRFIFLTAEELTRFAPTTTRLPSVTGLRFTLDAQAQQAVLVANALIPPTQTRRRDVGQAVASLCAQAPDNPDCAILRGATDAELNQALEAIALEEVSAPVDATASNASLQLRNVSARIANLQAGVEVQGLVLDPGEHALASGHLQELIGLSGGGASADTVAADFGRWGMYVQGSYGNGDKDATEQEAAFDYDSQGVTVGADWRYSDQLILGAALGYSKTDGEFGNDGGSLESDGYNLSLYGTYYRDEAFYLNATALVGTTDYDQDRRLSYTIGNTPVRQVFQADYDGSQTMISVGGGYEFNRGSRAYGPVARVEYQRTRIDGLDETPSSPGQPGATWAINTEDQTAHSLTTSLGGQASYAVSTAWGVVVPNARVEWVHEFRDDARSVTGWFAGQRDEPFAVRTDKPDRNYFNALVGASAVLPGGATAYGYVESTLGREDQKETTVGLGARWEFW